MTQIPVSPLAPASFPQLTPISGVRLGAIEAGFKYKNRPDLLLVALDEGTVAAGVFTKNRVKAAPVQWCQNALAENGGKVRALVVNSGNANAYTGKRGQTTVARVAAHTASLLGCEENEVMLASTGVIGETLPAGRFYKPLDRVVEGLSTGMWGDAARAIMTTDTFPKAAGRLVTVGSDTAVINGIVKGSGMINPNMATMLGFIFTNMAITPACLSAALSAANARSFNAATVDGDTSTNDTVLCFATGKTASANPISDISDPRFDAFVAGLTDVMAELAKQLVRDGEGARHFVTIDITGAASEAEARQVGMTIANSPLVKTAIAGEDPNWGRILMATGNAGVDFDQYAISLWIGEQLVSSGGSVQRGYSEEEAARHMKQPDMKIRVDLAMGEASATVWTCDLTEGYIKINADYRS